MTTSARHPFLNVFALCALLLLALPAQAADPGATQAHTFSQALQAARDNRWPQLDNLEKQLGRHFLLQDYLDYHRLRRQLPDLPVRKIEAYAKHYPDSPLPASLQRLATRQYAQAGRWKDLLRLHGDQVPTGTEAQCLYYRALHESDPEAALQAGLSLWLHGESLPAGCDGLFRLLQNAGLLDDDRLWQRMLLAFRAGSPGLMRFLRQDMQDAAWQAKADQLLRLYEQPARIDTLLDSADADTLFVSLHRLASQQPVETLNRLVTVRQQALLSDAQIADIEQRIAWASSLRDLPENRDWLQRYLQDYPDNTLLERRLRGAIGQQDWPQVEYWIQHWPAAADSGRWQYWLGRALAARNAPEADAHFQRAAAERSFWGFLAAERLGLPPAWNAETPVDGASVDAAGQRRLQRMGLLLAIGETGHAREEWLFHLRRLQDDTQREALAQAALHNGWADFAIDAALQAKRHHRIDWRFPVAYPAHFQQAAAEHGIDPWLLMAVARRESAFRPTARSPVGALGLMQLMPATAGQVARERGQPAPTEQRLFQPEINIALGSHYLASLLRRYDGNRLLALAAYNAGPHRVTRWVLDGERQRPADVFLETIPFQETREYVQAVLAYRLILARDDAQPESRELLTAQERTERY